MVSAGAHEATCSIKKSLYLSLRNDAHVGLGLTCCDLRQNDLKAQGSAYRNTCRCIGLVCSSCRSFVAF